jgi:hypothetical protein
MSFFEPVYVKDQYSDSSNLDARIALHARFSTAPYDFHRWVFDRSKSTLHSTEQFRQQRALRFSLPSRSNT